MDQKIKRILAVFAAVMVLAALGVSADVYAANRNFAANAVSGVSEPEHKMPSSDEIADRLKTRLEPLVNSGTITKNQQEQIINYMKEKSDQKRAEMEKIKLMTEAERKAYFESKAKNRPDIINELVQQKIIDTSQKDAVQKDIGHMFPGNKKDHRGKMKNTFDSAVKSQVITKEQEDKILAYINELEKGRKAEMDKVSKMTDAEKKAYFEKNVKTARGDIFIQLVSSKIITQAQADKIKAMMRACPGKTETNKDIDKEKEIN